jgi:hypothetical protein
MFQDRGELSLKYTASVPLAAKMSESGEPSAAPLS